ncbi:hypothetical protein ACWC09_00480 [Streptomyces sp. NPDC001617]
MRGDVADPLRRHHTGPETRSGALWLDPVPLPEPRRTASPRSEASAIDVRLADRAVSLRPEESGRLPLVD